ncbi:MAG TPA: ATP-binding protein, partial [Thermoanaerobaculia bacterium]|nr:ATP-binding protein [Thermoanaerobaculia bacterium]
TIYQIVSDRRGRVYVGSPEGFARLSLRADGIADVVPLTRGDELPADASDYASYLDSRGRVFLATTAGLAVVDPEAEEETPRNPRPLLLETARSTAKGTRLTDGTTLAHDDSGVTFALTLLDYAADPPPLYQTWLEGLESGPGSFTSERAIRFTSLPAGDYVFHASGLDHRGVVSAPVALRFRVGRSPLRTPLAYAIYALAAVLFVGGAVRVHEAALVRKNRALENLVEARTREVTYARDEALAGNRAKSAFLASMSHELRTPLSAIIGYAEMLQEDLEKEAPEAAADLGKIEAAARHQLQLVSEILDLSKVEAGKVELDLDDVNLDSLIEDAATSVAPLVEKNGNRLVVDVPERLGVLRVDALRLRQILLNLLSNASKFTKEGTITLSGRVEGGEVVLAVKDTGIGVTQEQLSRLFKPFTQADAAVAARYGGTGLGLTIAKSFCELMGGSISVASEPGKGSTFTVRLPRSNAADS